MVSGYSTDPKRIEGSNFPKLISTLIVCSILCWIGTSVFRSSLFFSTLLGVSGIGLTVAIIGFSVIYFSEVRPEVMRRMNDFRKFVQSAPADLPIDADFSLGQVIFTPFVPAGTRVFIYGDVRQTREDSPETYSNGFISGKIKFTSGREYIFEDRIVFNKIQKYCLKLNPHFKSNFCNFFDDCLMLNCVM